MTNRIQWMSSGHSSLRSSNTVSMASCNDVRLISWGFLHKTLDKREVNFDRKVEQETCLFNGTFWRFAGFFSTKTPMLAMFDQKKHLENPPRALIARCKLNFSHVSSTSACCAATKAANGDKSWECCCCLLLRSWLLTSSSDFCGWSGWNWDASSWSRLKGNSFLT